MKYKLFSSKLGRDFNYSIFLQNQKIYQKIYKEIDFGSTMTGINKTPISSLIEARLIKFHWNNNTSDIKTWLRYNGKLFIKEY